MPERSEMMRVYTFTLPKFVSGFVRKCMTVLQKEEGSSSTVKKKKKRQNKMPG